MHGGMDKKELANENLDALRKGIANLEKHIENIKKFGLPAIVAINAFPTDTKAELEEKSKRLEQLEQEKKQLEKHFLGRFVLEKYNKNK